MVRILAPHRFRAPIDNHQDITALTPHRSEGVNRWGQWGMRMVPEQGGQFGAVPICQFNVPLMR